MSTLAPCASCGRPADPGAPVPLRRQILHDMRYFKDEKSVGLCRTGLKEKELDLRVVSFESLAYRCRSQKDKSLIAILEAAAASEKDARAKETMERTVRGLKP